MGRSRNYRLKRKEEELVVFEHLLLTLKDLFMAFSFSFSFFFFSLLVMDYGLTDSQLLTCTHKLAQSYTQKKNPSPHNKKKKLF